MVDYELKVLRYLGGDDTLKTDLYWGAAMSEALEYLRGNGYIRRVSFNHEITEKGRQVLEKWRNEHKQDCEK